MMIVLHPTYTMRVTIKDKLPQVGNQAGLGASVLSQGNQSMHKFADLLNGKSGCDEAVAAVAKALRDAHIEADVWLERFEHKS